MVDGEKRHSRQFMGKGVVSKAGKRYGEVANLTFEPKTGEIIHLVLKNPTPYASAIELEKTKEGELLIPFSSVMAIGDFIVIAEEDIL
ncbi:MAG TPA: PRC-barrel domain-containing protein [Candidatus Nanoarchaeia archaeon]|nr:PRC-barrel domain-containing protein [Candidatus Nanoarchaeia archaeon]